MQQVLSSKLQHSLKKISNKVYQRLSITFGEPVRRTYCALPRTVTSSVQATQYIKFSVMDLDVALLANSPILSFQRSINNSYCFCVRCRSLSWNVISLTITQNWRFRTIWEVINLIYEIEIKIISTWTSGHENYSLQKHRIWQSLDYSLNHPRSTLRNWSIIEIFANTCGLTKRIYVICSSYTNRHTSTSSRTFLNRKKFGPLISNEAYETNALFLALIFCMMKKPQVSNTWHWY
jgi:hypothetical protein